MVRAFCIIVLSTSLGFSQIGYSQGGISESKSPKRTIIKKKRVELKGQSAIEVRFSYPKWDKFTNEIDSGVIIIRDSNSKKVIQVLLEETAPESNIYSGTFSINWGGDQSIAPEVYVLDNTQLLSPEALKSSISKIQTGEIKRKPMLYRENESGVRVLEIFDSKEKAMEAASLIVEPPRGGDVTSVVEKDFGVTKKLLSVNSFKKLLEEDSIRKKTNQKRILDRFRSEQLEKDRVLKIEKEFKSLSKTKREKSVQDASEYGEAALDFYRSNNFEESEGSFKKSFDLNPEQKKYYFQYGMSLFKNQKYNEAIIIFKASQKNPEFYLESLYYQSLSHYFLKEYELALKGLEEVQQGSNKKLSSLALFYEGIVFYDQKQYEKSRASFEKVLETSEDPRLDEKAENYIEQILKIEQYARMRDKKFFLSTSLGSLYDSNVLQQSDSSSDQGAPSDKSSLRYIAGLGFYYRPIYEENREFGFKVRSDYIYTQKDKLSDYDPLSLQITAPYIYHGQSDSKNYTLHMTPGYELLHLGQEPNSGRPQKTLKAFFLETSGAWSVSPDWVSGGGLNLRRDDFFEDPGKNAMKYTLKWTNIFLVGKSKSQNILADLGVTRNAAKNKINTFNRIDLNSLFITPVFKKQYSFIGGLSIYKLDYTGKPEEQTDMNYSFSANLAKSLNDWLNGMLVSSYTINKSDVASSDYKRWSIGFVLTADFGF